MAHCSKCTNQNKDIDKIYNNMIDKCNAKTKSVTALMIGDLKMKFEPLSSQETTIDHYEKCGISWHGFCIQFYLLQSMASQSCNVSTKLLPVLSIVTNR